MLVNFGRSVSRGATGEVSPIGLRLFPGLPLTVMPMNEQVRRGLVQVEPWPEDPEIQRLLEKLEEEEIQRQSVIDLDRRMLKFRRKHQEEEMQHQPLVDAGKGMRKHLEEEEMRHQSFIDAGRGMRKHQEEEMRHQSFIDAGKGMRKHQEEEMQRQSVIDAGKGMRRHLRRVGEEEDELQFRSGPDIIGPEEFRRRGELGLLEPDPETMRKKYRTGLLEEPKP